MEQHLFRSEAFFFYLNDKSFIFLNLGDESLSISIAELKDKASIIYQANEDIEVVFKGDKDVKFESIARAMAAVQSVGITKIGIVTSGYVQE